MAEKDKEAKKPAPGAKGGGKSAGAKKPSKAKSKPPAEEEKQAVPQKEEAPKTEEEKPAFEEEAKSEETLIDESKEDAEGEKGEMSEEEFRRLVEESLEKVTVAEIALTMMNQLASVGFLKMGLPENVNLKYRDFDQARLAIDILEAMLKGAEGKIPEEALQAFRGTLANMQLNFVQLKRGQG